MFNNGTGKILARAIRDLRIKLVNDYSNPTLEAVDKNIFFNNINDYVAKYTEIFSTSYEREKEKCSVTIFRKPEPPVKPKKPSFMKKPKQHNSDVGQLARE